MTAVNAQPKQMDNRNNTDKFRQSNPTKFAKILLSLVRGKTTKPYYNENTYFVWEPCSKSHAEVVPGYCKLLLDAGYNVSVLIEPKRIDEGLFSNFEH